jgi:hypothetical protein
MARPRIDKLRRPSHGQHAGATESPYSGFELRLGDTDSAGSVPAVYGGVRRPGLPPASHVRQLQTDLAKLRFFRPAPTGIFDIRTEWAVREFQTYAGLTQAASDNSNPGTTDYWNHYTPTTLDNDARMLPSDIDGVVTQKTAQRIRTWLGSNANLRCPVVINCYQLAQDNSRTEVVLGDNLWAHDDHAESDGRMYVRDWTGRTGTDANQWQPLGTYLEYSSYGGPAAQAGKQTLPSGAFTPDNVIGLASSALTDAQKSTFRVLWGSSFPEIGGQLDALNAYDNAFLSFGPCQWTISPAEVIVENKPVAQEKGELPAFLAWLKSHASSSFSDLMPGMVVVSGETPAPPSSDEAEAAWDEGVLRQGEQFSNLSQRKYEAYLGMRAYRKIGAANAPTFLRRLDTLVKPGPAGGTYSELDLFRSWHWFYRFALAARSDSDFRKAIWPMARSRLRDILATPFPPGVVASIDNGAGGRRVPMIGDVFQSELAVAFLLRWHINRPGHVISGGRAGDMLIAAWQASSLSSDISAYTDNDEGTLTSKLRDAIIDANVATAEDLDNITNTTVLDLGKLTTGRSSGGNGFHGDFQDLVPVPTRYPAAGNFDWTNPQHRRLSLRALKNDLRHVGFNIANESDEGARIAIREFKRATRESNVAIAHPFPYTPKTLPLSFDAAPLPALPGTPWPADDVVDQGVMGALVLWRSSGWCNPLVVSSREHDGTGNLGDVTRNFLWDRDEKKVNWVFARDLAPVFAGITGNVRTDGLIGVGQTSQDSHQRVSPTAFAPTQAAAFWQRSPVEVLPETLPGAAWGTLTDEAKATFLVLRAVSQLETSAFIDGAAADKSGRLAFLFAGLPSPLPAASAPFPTHGRSKLGAFAAYLRATDPATFDATFGHFGAAPDKSWGANGGDLFQKDQRVYSGAFHWDGDTASKVPLRHLAGWTWYTRLILFARAFPQKFGSATWGFARTQLRELLQTTIRLKDYKRPMNAPTLPNVAYTIGEVFTSQQAVALLFAWFLRRPEDLVNAGGVVSSATSGLGKVLDDSRADLPLSTVPAETWDDSLELKLVTRLTSFLSNSANPDLQAIPQLGGWPPPVISNDPWSLPAGQRTPLTTTRGLHHVTADRFFFSLDVSGLTPVPTLTVASHAGQRPLTSTTAAYLERPTVPHTLDEPATREAVRLSPARDLGSGSVDFGVYLLGTPDASETGPFHADAVAFSIPGDDGEEGWEVPLKSPFDFHGPLESEPLAAVRVRSVGDDTELLPALGLATSTSSFSFMLELDTSDTLPDGSQVEQTVVQVSNLSRTGAGDPTGQVALNVTLGGPGVSGNPVWTFPAAIDTTTPATFGRLQVGDTGLGLSASVSADGFAFGLPVSGPLTGNLVVSLTHEEVVDAAFHNTASTDDAKLDLGSPLAQFVLPQGSPVNWSFRDGFRLTVLNGATTHLQLDLFDKIPSGAVSAVVAHAWKDAAEAGWLLRFSNPIDDLPDTLRQIVWDQGNPSLTTELLAATVGSLLPDLANDRELVDLAPPSLAGLPRMSTRFGSSTVLPWLDFGGDSATLSVPLEPVLGTPGGQDVLHASGVLTFAFDVPPAGGRIQFKTGSLRCTGSADLTTTNTPSYDAGLFRLDVPAGLTFRLGLGVGKVTLALVRQSEPPDGPTAPITLTFPGDYTGSVDPFVFEMNEFAVHGSGLDFRGIVRAGRVGLGDSKDTGIQNAVDVQPPATVGTGDQEPTVGEVVFRNSKLVGCSLRATATLPFFDDAVGILTLRVTEENGSFTAAGVLEIDGLPKFHVSSLFLTFEIPVLTFAIKYQAKHWNSDIKMTGTITAESPEGSPEGEIGELLSDFLAKRLSVSFENLDLRSLNATALTFNCAPQSFEILDVLSVDLNGMRVGKLLDPGNPETSTLVLGLLGDVSLDGLELLNAQLTFGGITLKQKLQNDVPTGDPAITIESISIALTPPAGFEASGTLKKLQGGFEAELELETDFLPRTRLLGRSAPVTAGDGTKVPGFAVAAEVGVTSALYAGFFLRSVGFGFGVNNTLSGLDNSANPNLTGVDRVIALVQQPNGPPDPSVLDSWVDDPPANGNSTRWTIAGVGGITYGNLAEDEEHPLVARIIVAFDSRLEILIGANVWVYAAPDQVTDPSYLAHPLARAAIMVFPHEPRISAYAETLPDAKMGESVPEIVSQAVAAVRANLSVDAVPSSFEVKVGWPRELQYQYDLGSIFHAYVAAGFRFGIAGGAVTFGLNLGAGLQVELGGSAGFDTRAGSASADISANFDAAADLELLGALAHRGAVLLPYLVGHVHVAASLNVHASAHCRLGPKYSPLKISFSENKRLASVDLDGDLGFYEGTGPSSLGFRGHVSVSFSVCGYDLSGGMSFAWQDHIVDQAKDRIKELTPAPPTASRNLPGPYVAPPLISTTPAWHYRYTKPPPNDQSKTKLIRVLLFPAPGNVYEPPAAHLRRSSTPRFQLKLTDAGNSAFQGFRGSEGGRQGSGNDLEWDEDLDTPFLDAIVDGQDQKIGLRPVLQALSTEPEPRLTRPEITDEWLTRPQVSDANDGTAGIRPPDMFPLRRRRLPNTRNSYDNLRLIACTTPPPPQLHANGKSRHGDDEPFGLPMGWLFNDLVSLLCYEPDALTDDQYALVRRMRLVLEFEVIQGSGESDDDWETKWKWTDETSDPVPLLIDLSTTAGAPRLAGESAMLALARGESVPTYALVPGNTFLSSSGVGLVWEFMRTDVALETLQVEDHYRECHQITVRRYRDGRLDREFPCVSGAWFQPRNSDGSLMNIMARVPYQFIDNDVSGFRENEWLRYEVIAQAPDRVLQRADIGVHWRTLRPLPTLRQAQVLHRLVAPDDSTGAYVMGNLEFAVAFRPEDGFDAPGPGGVDYRRDLKVHYQFVDAPRVGHYGFGARRPGTPQAGPATAPVDPDFTDATADDTPALWEQVPDELTMGDGSPLTWDEIYEGNTPLGLRAVVPEQVLRDKLQGAGPNRAVEFFVGIEMPKAVDRPSARSPLRVMRHAVLLPPLNITPAFGAGEVESEYFSRGNMVEAIELLPAQPSNEWLLGEVFASPAVDPAHRDRLALRWQHPESGFDTKSIPISGYKVFRIDAHSPLEYPKRDPHSGVGMSARCERTVEAWPMPLYRAYPRHVVPRLLGTDTLSLTYAQRPDITPSQTLWNADTSQEVVPFPPRLYRNASDDRSWFHPHLVDVANEVARVLETKGFPEPYFELTATEPLRDRGTGTFDETEPYTNRLNDVLQRLPAVREDPYGWTAAESIGLSCECVWRDASGLPIASSWLDNTDVVKALATSLANRQVMIVRFVAEDGATRLDTVRLVFAAPMSFWQVWPVGTPTASYDFDEALGLLLAGRVDGDNPSGIDVPHRSDPKLQAALTGWLTGDPNQPDPNSIYCRTQQDKWQAGQLIDLYPAGAMLPSVPIPCRARVTVPIGLDGSVQVALPIPDLLAHRYQVGVQIVRRYDELWRALLTAATPDPQSGGRTDVPVEAVHTVHVPRTARLDGRDPGANEPDTGPAILIAPTPGGVEVMVFRHPAEYASAANAVNKAYFEFSGQHLALVRQIPGGLSGKSDLETIYKGFVGHANSSDPISWPGYQTWVAGPDGTEHTGPLPFMRLAGENDERQVALFAPLPASLRPKAKADAFVFPSLPEYYEYHAVAHCTAGLSRTDVSTTGRIRPLFRWPAQWPRSSCYDGLTVSLDATSGVLKFGLPLPHPRQYLARELRPLWVDSDVTLDVGASAPLRFGSLPDLFARMLVYVWDRQPDYQEGGTKVLLPLVEVFSPLSPDHPGGDAPWYAARCPVLSDLTPDVETLTQSKSTNHAGRLELQVVMTFTSEPRHVELLRRLERLAATESTQHWFFVVTERSGVTSHFCPPLDSAECQTGGNDDCA